MKSKIGHNEWQVLKSLQKKHDISIDGRIIKVLWGKEAKGDIGNKTKGKIDYLSHYHGYHVTFTRHF